MCPCSTNLSEVVSSSSVIAAPIVASVAVVMPDDVVIPVASEANVISENVSTNYTIQSAAVTCRHTN